MHYLRDGLAELGAPRSGRALSVVFALMCIGGSFGGGNMFQSNQCFAQISSPAVLPVLANPEGAVLFGLVLSLLVGAVIIGGIRRIGDVAARLVPFMCVLYLLCGLMILALHAEQVPQGLLTMVRAAFSLEAGAGGLLGSLIQGFRRAAFSNEAGCGSSAIVHSAAQTEEPVREGMVALLEPFIDTVIICTTTGLVLVVTGAYAAEGAGQGIQMASWAFATVFPWFPLLLSFTATLFAFSTMISWSYYGEQCWVHLFGVRSILVYKLIFLLFAWAGAVFSAAPVIAFSDAMILGMAFPNLIGAVLLSGRVRADLDAYLGKLESGGFKRYEVTRPRYSPPA
jgi:AGCS family alanine or glycine:cation symporter